MNVKLGYVKIDVARLSDTCEAYFKWKDLNTYIASTSKRGINMPDAISEPIGCYCLNLLWNRGSEPGDATDPVTNEIIEFKATSNFNKDLSSFGPRTSFDKLVFLRFNLDKNQLYIYDLNINSDEFAYIPVSSTQTVGDQQKERRRPRLSIINHFIKSNNLDPTVVFDIRLMKIVKID